MLIDMTLPPAGDKVLLETVAHGAVVKTGGKSWYMKFCLQLIKRLQGIAFIELKDIFNSG